jgi:Zn-dependent protease with chaperone function
MRCRSALLALLLAGSAASDAAELYLVDSLAEQSGHAPVRAQAHELAAIYADLVRVSGVEAQLVWSSDPDLNAFATEAGEQKLVVVQEGLLTKFDSDRDAVAAVLGHELAHHKGDHVRAGRRKQEGVRVFGAILGAVIGAKVGRNSGALAGVASNVAVNAGANLLALKFNRNQELQADRWAVQWMIEAGYNPRGMLRLQQQLGALAGQKRRLGMLATHPNSSKRYQAAQRQIDALAPPPALLEREARALVDDAALAQAEQSLATAEARRVAEALAPAAAEPLPAAALEPIEGVAFAEYAALGNQLLQAGSAGQARVLQRRRIDAPRMAALQAGFGARMQQHPALAQRYSIEFFRASQGRFASYGRDLADSLEHGRPLQLAPPFPLETAAALHAALTARGAPALDAAALAAAELELLAPLDLSWYDWTIAHNWWSRQVTVAALSGDTRPLQVYFGAAEAAPAAPDSSPNVRIGENVELGAGVRIGARAVPPSGE